MKPIFLFLLLFTSFFVAQGQQKQLHVKGRVLDFSSREPLPGAIVIMLNAKDSTMHSNTAAAVSGDFTIAAQHGGQYKLKVQFMGYETFTQAINYQDTTTIVQLGDIFMNMKNVTLAGVEIVQQRPPMVVKKDTVEYNAGSFKTQPNALLEELLKKMPGLKLEADGSLTYNGEPIPELMLDGRPLFSDDPKTATKNLPADIVDRIQIIDKQSRDNELSGVSGKKVKALNIVLKADRRKGVYGNVNAAGGNDERYLVGMNLNRFNGPQQIMLNGTMGNVPPGGASMAGQLKTKNLGFTYNSDVTKKLRVNASYNFSKNEMLMQRSNNREYFSVDSTKYNRSNSQNLNQTEAHRFGARFEYTIDSTQMLIWSPSVSYNRTNTNTLNNFEISSVTNTMRNKGLDNTTNESTTPNVNMNLMYRKKFAKKGRSLNTMLTFGNNSSDRIGYLNSARLLKDSLNNDVADTTRQQNLSDNKGQTLGVRVTYVEPVGNGRFLEASYGYNRNLMRNVKNTFNWDTLKGGYTGFVDSLSNSFKNTTSFQNVGLNFRTNRLKYNYVFGLNMQVNDLQSLDRTKDSTSHQRTVNFAPMATFDYTFAGNKQLYMSYNGQTQQPTLQQLQPVVDRSNSLYIVTGNPNLRPSFTHNMNINLSAFNPATMRGFNLGVNGTTTMNKIVNKSFFDENGVQYSMPENLSGAYNVSAFLSNNLFLKKIKASLSFATALSYSNDVSFLNSEKNLTKNMSVTETVNFNFNYKELLELGVAGSVGYNSAKSSLTKAANNNYLSATGQLNFTVHLPGKIHIGSASTYSYTAGRSQGYDLNNAIVNGYIYKNFFKNNMAELRFTAYDIFNQNVSLTRNVYENYIDDVRTDVMQRYFMLAVIIHINKFGGGAPKKAAMPTSIK
ncbi:carboxypeptidase-like protein [Chitinophaga skermanii]|uniref:Carboxypeptidase-like protein n=1 Tax=Chitinophaga skermanii TaxID=331697 RepID=A0A327QCA3_9BACT|nr:outer membrane beta-barrel protein [Chitinophaga skermanii]RAJ01498.1 carboxypeptidase-like protein [Chitinophaga skermanii]